MLTESPEEIFLRFERLKTVWCELALRQILPTIPWLSLQCLRARSDIAEAFALRRLKQFQGCLFDRSAEKSNPQIKGVIGPRGPKDRLLSISPGGFSF